MTARVLILFCTLFVASCAAFDFEDPKPQDYPIHGIDVARYQGDIDWHRVKKAGTEFAWIKATEGGDYLDPKFMENWTNAKAAGVRRGAYHFYFFCRPVEDQIAWFIANVPVDPDALPPVLDMEWNGHSWCRERPGREKVLHDMDLFLRAMESHYGKRPVIYSSVDFHRDRLVGAKRGYDFWLRSVAAHPNRRYEDRRDWVFWQYTAKGRVDGIKGDVDRNAFHGSRRQWQRWLQGHRTR